MPLPNIDTPEFNAWVDKVRPHLAETPRESDLLLFLRQYWQQRQNWTKPPKPQKAAEAFENEESDKPDEMKKLRNGTAYDDVNEEPDGYKPGHIWCATCYGWVEAVENGKPHKHLTFEEMDEIAKKDREREEIVKQKNAENAAKKGEGDGK